jgi:hypothetical protein
MRSLVLSLVLVSGAAHAAHHGSHASSRAYSPAPHRSHEHRSQAAKDAFKRASPCPGNGHTSGACPGYVIDHVKPLACGGADAPSNMQWQTVEAGKAKDKVERVGCK